MTAYRESFGFQALPQANTFTEEWIRNIVIAHQKPKPSAEPRPSRLETLRAVLKVIKPFCERCRREVDRAEVVPSASEDAVYIDVECHDAWERLRISGKALADATANGPKAVIDLATQPVFMGRRREIPL